MVHRVFLNLCSIMKGEYTCEWGDDPQHSHRACTKRRMRLPRVCADACDEYRFVQRTSSFTSPRPRVVSISDRSYPTRTWFRMDRFTHRGEVFCFCHNL